MERLLGTERGVPHELHQQVADIAQLIVLILDAEGRIIRFNHYMELLSGYRLEEVQGKDWFETFLPQQDHEAIRGVFAQAKAGTQTRGQVNPILTRDGQLRWIQWHDHVIRSEAHEIVAILATGLDITERTQAEQALREKDEFQRAILDSVFAHIAVLDRRGTILAVNEPWRRFARENRGTRSEEAGDVGVCYLTVCRQATGDEAQCALRAAAGIESVLRGEIDRFTLEYPCRTHDEEHWYSMVVTPMRGSSGGAVVAHTDISDRKKIENSLRQTERRFRATFEQAAVGIGHTGPDGRWLRVNRKLCEISGYDRDELQQRTFRDITYAPDLALDLEVARKLNAGELQTHAAEKRFIHKKGHLVWINRTVSVVLRGDRSPEYFIVVIEDIGERKRTEAQLQRVRAEMEQLMRVHVAIQTIAAIAHELHQPLNAITTYSEAAIRNLESDDPRPDRMKRAIEGSAEQAHRAANVVRELMEVVDRGTGEREAVDLNAAVLRAVRIFDDADEFQLLANLDLDPALPPVFANRLQIEKVLTNLLQNGADAMRAGGLTGASAAMAISTRSDGTMAHLTVRDSGPGLNLETASRIFDPFFSSKQSGLGMGLPISRAIVEANGGQLWVDPQPIGGACFHFTLPFAP